MTIELVYRSESDFGILKSRFFKSRFNLFHIISHVDVLLCFFYMIFFTFCFISLPSMYVDMVLFMMFLLWLPAQNKY